MLLIIYGSRYLIAQIYTRYMTPASGTKNSFDPQSFLLEEYGALRREIELERKELGLYLRYAVVSSGAIWAWTLSTPNTPLSRVT